MNEDHEKSPLFPSDLFTLEQRLDAAFILHIIGALYMLLALAIVSDEFFLPSLYAIIKKLGYRSDTAGADFMIAAGSVPLLFFCIVCVFISFSNTGFDVVIASAGSNILFITGLCGLWTKTVILVPKWLFIRGFLFFCIALLMLFVIVYDKQAYWWEVLQLLLVYVIYAVFMRWNQQKSVEVMTAELEPGQLEINNEEDDEKVEESKLKLGMRLSIMHTIGLPSNSPPEITSLITWPLRKIDRVVYILELPITFPLWLTIPNLRTPEGRKLLPITFIVSLIWIAIYSYFLVWWSESISNKLIKNDVFSFWILPLGISLLDYKVSKVAARLGYGHEAISNTFSKNIFSITVSLPLPWLIYSIAYNEPFEINSNRILCSIMMLFLMMVLFVLLIGIFKFKMKKKMGYLLILMHLASYMSFLAFGKGRFKCPL